MIDLARDFSPYPSGRISKDGNFNGAKFREKHLLPAIETILGGKSGDTEIIVDIDGVRSFGSSFLEEAFGGLARASLKDVRAAVKLLKIKCTKPHLLIYKDTIEEYLADAQMVNGT